MTEPDLQSNPDDSTATSATARKHGRAALAYGLAAIAVLGYLLWSLLLPNPWHMSSNVRIVVPVENNAYHVTERQWRRAFKRSMSALARGERIAFQAIERDVETRVSDAFKLPKEKIKDAADWYYSIPGHATRMLAPLGVDVAERLSRRVFPDEEWGQAQANLIAGLTRATSDHGQNAIDRMMTTLHAELEPGRTDAIANSSVKDVSVDFRDDRLLQWLQDDPALERQGIAVAAGVVSSAAARQVAKAAAARAAARIGAAKGSVACAGTGPLAWVCVAGVFTGTLVVSEWAIVTIDEAVNRDNFETMLVAEVEKIELQMKQTLRASLTKGLSDQFKERRATINWKVRPIELVFASARSL